MGFAMEGKVLIMEISFNGLTTKAANLEFAFKVDKDKINKEMKI